MGASQLAKAPRWVARRRAIAKKYDKAFAKLEGVLPLANRKGTANAYHLYVVQVDPKSVRGGRDAVFAGMRARGIGVNVHYLPVHLNPFYRKRFGTRPGLCPAAEAAFGRILSLPMFPRMTGREVQSTIHALQATVRALSH